MLLLTAEIEPGGTPGPIYSMGIQPPTAVVYLKDGRHVRVQIHEVAAAFEIEETK